MNTLIAREPSVVLETIAPVSESQPTEPKPRKPRIWTAFATLFCAVFVGQVASLLAIVVVAVVTALVMGSQGAVGDQIQARIEEICRQPLILLLLSLIPVQLGMTAVVLFAARRSKESIRQRLGLLPQSGRVFGRLKLARIAAFTVSTSLVCLILSRVLIPAPQTHNPISAVIDDGSWWAITLLSILLSVIPAIVEESLFRGYLQRRLLQRWSPAVAILVSTTLFAMMHFDSVHHIISVVPLGLVVGLLAYRTNSIKPGMLVHGIHNATVVGIAALSNGLSAHISSEATGAVGLGLIGVLGLIGLPTAISLLRRPKTLPSVETPPAPRMVVEFVSSSNGAFDRRRNAFDSTLASSGL